MGTVNIHPINSDKTNDLGQINPLVALQRKVLHLAACLVSPLFLVHYKCDAQKYDKERYFRFSKISCWKTLKS